jgi:hypothetical protein
MSTHPASDTRIKDIQAKLPKVAPLYAKAAKPTQVYGPPPLNTAPAITPAAQR